MSKNKDTNLSNAITDLEMYLKISNSIRKDNINKILE
jgi:hypothetical protein